MDIENKDIKDVLYLHPKMQRWMPTHLRLIDVLLLLPDFDQEIDNIRQSLKIQPKKVLSELKDFLGVNDFKKYVAFLKDLNAMVFDLTDTPLDLHECLKINKKVRALLKEMYPKLDTEIRRLRIEVYGLPTYASQTLYHWILFNLKDAQSAFPKSNTSPKYFSSQDENMEPCIVIRVYGDSDISTKSSFLTNDLKKIRELQRDLPTYFKTPTENSKYAYIRSWLYLYLTEVKNLTHADANEVLNDNNMIPIEHGHISQATKARFLDLYQKSK